MTMADILVNFVTKDEKYAVPSVPINVKCTSIAEEFDRIIKTLLKESHQNDLLEVEFDFLVNGKLLRSTIQEVIQQENISPELQIEVEYFVKSRPPRPYKSFLHDDWVSSVDTIDRWIISGCYDSTAHIWNVLDGEHKIAIPAHTCSIKAVKWLRKKNQTDDDLYHFITCSYDETSMLWNWNSKRNEIEHIFTYIGHSRSVDCVDTQDDLIATGSYDRMLKIWSSNTTETDMDAGEQSKKKLRSPAITLEGHKEAITGVVWLTDHELPTVATTSLDQTIKIWDIEVGETKQTLSANKSLLGLAHCPRTGLLITASCDRHIRLWDLRQSQTHGSLVKQTFSSHEGWISSVAWSTTDDNLFVSGGYDSSVKQWDIRSPNAPLYDMLGHQDKVMAVNWSNKQFIVSGGADCQIKIFST